MHRMLILGLMIGLLSLALPAAAQDGLVAPGVAVTCPNGITFNNGVELVVNMRAGFTYTATAVGIGDFDPVLAVRDARGNTLCNDDFRDAAFYDFNLPTTGLVAVSPFSAQLPFSYSGSGFGNVSVIVGSPLNAEGQFLLLVEGLAVTTADGSGGSAGDPFSLRITPNVQAAGLDPAAYMIAVTSALDPYLRVQDANDAPLRLDDSALMACDDAGGAGYCWGEFYDLGAGYYISRSGDRTLGGGSRDAMMIIPLNTLGLDLQADAYLTWRFTSYEQGTYGDYVAAFHVGTRDVYAPDGGGSSGGASAQDDGGSNAAPSANFSAGGLTLDAPAGWTSQAQDALRFVLGSSQAAVNSVFDGTELPAGDALAYIFLPEAVAADFSVSTQVDAEVLVRTVIASLGFESVMTEVSSAIVDGRRIAQTGDSLLGLVYVYAVETSSGTVLLVLLASEGGALTQTQTDALAQSIRMD